MADEEAEDMEQSLAGKSFLFPIVAANNEDKHDAKEIKPLFPLVSVDHIEEKEPHDWLSNDSYKETFVENRPSASTEKHSPKLRNLEEQDGCKSGETDSHSSGVDQPSRNMTKLTRRHDRKQKTKKHKKHKHKRNNRDQKLKLKEEEKLMKLPSTIWIEESGLELEKAFRIHKKPDHDNRSFGGLYRLDIALHKQYPKLKCLGLKPDQVVDIEPKKKKKKTTESPQRYWAHKDLSAPGSLLVACQVTGTAGKASYGFSKNFSYVPLELPSAAGETTGIGEMMSGNVKQVVPDELTSQTKNFNQRVREDPSDVKAWLALAELQSEHVQFGDNLTLNSLNKIGLEKHKKTSKISLEKKLAVLEQAVAKNPSSSDLIIPYMDLCVETASSDKIADKWRDILFNQPQKTLLWKHYLMFCQSNFSTFSVSNTLATYSKCFSTLSAIRDGVFKSHSPEDGMEVGMVEIFVQFCQFLRQTGHAEKAVAAFQALIEFNCFRPKSLEEDHTTASAVSFFETFWDSDVPRFGENNACGWGSWMENNSGGNRIPVGEIFSVVTSVQRKEKDVEQERIVSTGTEKAATWIQLELLREANQWQPKKTNDDDDDDDDDDELDVDDPDRVVFFQDISTALFKISQETLRFQLVSFILAFLGVPTELCSFDALTSFDPPDSFDPHHVRLQSLYQVLLEDDGQLSCSSDSPRGSRLSCSWTKLESKTSDASCLCLMPELRTFVRNVFSQALEAFSEEQQSTLVVHWLGFEKDLLLSETNSKQRKQCYKAVRKLAKSLLKLEHYCNNLKVWMAFVEVEWAFGNMNEARRIVSSSLGQFNLTSPDPNSNSAHYSFVRSYCEMEMVLRNPVDGTPEKIDFVNDERKNRILGTIAVLVENGTALETAVTPSRILKMHRALQERASQMLTDVQKWNFEAARSGQVLVDFMICYALFQYWSLGIDAARSVLDSLLSSFAFNGQKFSGSKYHEEILVFYCRLLQFHSRHGVCPVKPLRDLLLLALSTFQESPFFLHSYVTLELKSCASYSARRFFDQILPKSQTPVPWLFAILYERRRQKAIWSATQNSFEVFQNPEDVKTSQPSTALPKSGVDHRLRSLYERAILHPSARHCVALWRSYMNFEAENGDLRQAKAIFYQSLQRCAWAKVLYLHAISISNDSLQDLHDLMEEKELRIRAPLDEIDLLLETCTNQP